MKRLLVVAFVSAPVACSLAGPSKEDNPRNVENANAPKVTEGTCEGDDAQTLTPASFFAGPYKASDMRPTAGTVVAFEGTPQGQLICTQLGCMSECCDNGCGFSSDCAYVLRAEGDKYNEICLEHSAFKCGGTDCSPFCEPFSVSPQQRYRFVGRIEYDDASLGKQPVLHVEKFCVAR